MNQKICYIFRGIPGSGKSTLAKKYMDKNSVYCSMDDLRMVDGEYVYDPNQTYFIVKSCQEKFDKAIDDGKNVIVDNTNLIRKEFKYYYNKAIESDYFVKVISIIGLSAEDSFKNNTHNVPLESCQDKLNKYSFIEEQFIYNNKGDYIGVFVNFDYMQLRAKCWYSFNIVSRNNGDGCFAKIIDCVFSEKTNPSKLPSMDGDYLFCKDLLFHEEICGAIFENKSFKKISYNDISNNFYYMKSDGGRVYYDESEFCEYFED
jgi:predicted kinase